MCVPSLLFKYVLDSYKMWENVRSLRDEKKTYVYPGCHGGLEFVFIIRAIYHSQSRKTYIVRKQTWPKVHIQCHQVSHDATLQCHSVSSRVPMSHNTVSPSVPPSHTTFQLQCHPAPHQVPPQCHKCDKTSVTRPSLFSTHFLPDKPSTHFFHCKNRGSRSRDPTGKD